MLFHVSMRLYAFTTQLYSEHVTICHFHIRVPFDLISAVVVRSFVNEAGPPPEATVTGQRSSDRPASVVWVQCTAPGRVADGVLR